MQFIVELDSTRHVLVVHANGEGDCGAIYELLKTIRGCADYRPAMPVLINALGTPYLSSRPELDTFPVLCASEPPGCPVAVVTRFGPAFNAGQMIEPLAQIGGLFGTFLTRDDGLRWLSRAET